MRRALCSFGLFLVVLSARAADAPPQANALTAEESADGWSLLFDGEKFHGFRIEGDYQVVDGVLILGGKTKTRLTTTRPLLRNFELRFLYRTEVPPDGSVPMAGIRSSEGFLGSWGESAFSLKWPRPEAVPDDWNEFVVKGQYDLQTGTHRVSDNEQLDLGMPGPGLPDDTAPKHVGVFFDVPAGSKLYLRDIKLKADPVSWWDTPWPYLAILVGILLAFCVMLWVAWRVLRRRWAAADAKPAA